MMRITNQALFQADHGFGECSDIMLLSTILQILNQHTAQPKIVEKTENTEKFVLNLDSPGKAPPGAKTVSSSGEKAPAGVRKTEIDVLAATGPASPFIHQPQGSLLAGLGLEELIRAVTKFEKPEPSRVVDVFE